MSPIEYSLGDTIYAVSTGWGKAAIAVIRISGSHTDAVLRLLCGRDNFVDRRATLASVFDGNGNLLDRAIVLRFLAPRSFTGESMAEIHVTGGRAVVGGVLATLGMLPGMRPAEAGEFARRAYENNKLDLAEIEGLASVVEAETQMQLRHALVLSSGELSRRCEGVRNSLVGAMATVETVLDFSDVEDGSEFTAEGTLPIVASAIEVLQQLCQGSIASERLRDGMLVVIAGPPNVGKSTLLNCLARRDVAIVSPHEGTTRDSLEVFMEISGYPVTFVDTAGIRLTSDPVEIEGVERSRRRAKTADLLLWLSDQNHPQHPAELTDCPVLAVRSKSDLPCPDIGNFPGPAISAKTGEGVGELLMQITGYVSRFFAGAGSVAIASERQNVAVRDAIEALSAIKQNPHRAPETIAEDLRRASTALGRVTARVGVEEVLGEIFSRLCVGK